MKFDKNGNGSVFASGLDTPESIAIKRDGTVPIIPTLSIRQVGTNAVLSWSTAATGYNLKFTASLSQPNWTVVLGTPATIGGNYVITNGISGSAKFFRLSNP
jgi:hypothetical protein